MQPLLQQECKPMTSGETSLDSQSISDLINELNNTWQYNQEKNTISQKFKFKNYYETMAFVNAAAWIAHQQDHHPDMEISYNQCQISFTTHSVSGLSLNDFICAARINNL